MNTLITIPFNNQTITAINHHGKPYIAMRPIVENLGLAWQVQHRKITDKFNRCVTLMVTHDSLGRKQEMLCLPLSKIAAFLYTISPSKAKPELRATIVQYQEECDAMLFEYFVGKQNTAFNSLITPLFNNHPQWQETSDLREYGFSTREIAAMQGKHQSNVQKMLARIKKAGINFIPKPGSVQKRLA